MTSLKNISQLKTNELWFVQPKWYKSMYELTDNAFTYAKLYTEGFWQTTTIFETVDERMSIRNLWNGGYEINNANGNSLGVLKRKVLSGRTTFTLNDGRFFTYKAPSMWKSEYVWEDELKNELLKINFGAFSNKTSVTFNNRAADIPAFSILIFMAFKLKMDNANHG